MLGCRPDQRVPRIGSESEPELRDHLIGEATPSEILQRGSPLRSPREDVMIESGRKSQGMKHRLAMPRLCPLPFPFLGKLQPGPLRQHPDGLREFHPFKPHHEAEYVAVLAASEAFVDG